MAKKDKSYTVCVNCKHYVYNKLTVTDDIHLERLAHRCHAKAGPILYSTDMVTGQEHWGNGIANCYDKNDGNCPDFVQK